MRFKIIRHFCRPKTTNLILNILLIIIEKLNGLYYITAEGPILNNRFSKKRNDFLEKQANVERELEDKLRREFVRRNNFNNQNNNDFLLFRKKTYSKWK